MTNAPPIRPPTPHLHNRCHSRLRLKDHKMIIGLKIVRPDDFIEVEAIWYAVVEGKKVTSMWPEKQFAEWRAKKIIGATVVTFDLTGADV